MVTGAALAKSPILSQHAVNSHVHPAMQSPTGLTIVDLKRRRMEEALNEERAQDGGTNAGPDSTLSRAAPKNMLSAGSGDQARREK